ncbi:serine/threonine-protein kinase ICK isoform X1 [Mus musculus]|uniref:Serine/threonine-protein kinase ICK n=3 Tax=Mus musculus TaxID=10090 RepID=CILK1_MOUSE|nr:serine/threonine-protein kinase ICK [Mus musculus]NP_064371.2 serine/threonine-protein kinase ICK [Mus musculus]XP_006511367.1 serine/threonine-protein kinase ICK isoform X1 [Mus musculus]Q9JKV2.2 RecName: Full=Serine/threonine-protein kinase ICK; AltName: Full=Intestinal cell kinase; Short=mICK; AltName: Full=MAK-related kinase; Short=MRK [Mus musculus]ABK42430.1 Kiaa0936 [synthetic construct]AAH28863.1 Intestinal cell kinase [Mus musculus]EDL26370.1 intestinal cell kinase, isoform CRA_a |eukprot:NP_001157252.1 serine/threonine-protein kinase ICK [Mus musculus]
MNRYTTIKQLGDGTYGSVLLGRSIESGELIAIKKMKRKFYSWEECMNLREVKSLKKLNHANIVKLKEVIRENDHLYFIFEYMKENLYQLIKERNKLFPESAIRNIMYQILQGLAFIHKHGFFHRDLKPENLLCMGPELVKIADFGLAREIRSRPPYTDYVSTRWYRAPEVLLRSTNYSSPIDIWAVGCIMAEVYTLRPLFPGASEIDTIFKICQVLGTPKKTDWPEGYQLSSAMNFLWPQCIPNNLKTLIPNASSEAIQLLRDLLQWDPKKRPTASQALRYPYFQIGHPLGIISKDSGKPQREVQDKTGPPPYIKPAPPAQAPAKAYTLISSRPSQASQPPQHSVHPYKGDVSRTEQLSHVQEGKPSPPFFPSLHNKNLQPKILASLEQKNGEIKPKSRRRWGLISRSTKGSDDWADLDDLDFSPSLTRIDVKNKKRQSDDTLCRFESVLDLKPSESVGTGTTVSTQASSQRRDTPTLQSSAKQHYLKHSRYLPGINIRNGVLPNPGKDFLPSNSWSSSGLSGKSSGTVSVVSKITSVGSGSASSSGLTGSYIPSFLKKEIGSVMQRVQLAPLAAPPPGYSSLKAVRPHPGRPFFHTQPRSTPGLIPRPPAAQPVHGRIDWSSKYPSRR